MKKSAPHDYQDWNPGLNNGGKTMAQILKTLPANQPVDIDTIVRLFENPASPIALPGAVSLERHDCIHILLGRGLLPQDEAFVIGFTMGTSKDISQLEEFIFKKVSTNLYPKRYRFTRKNMIAYQLGLQYGKSSKAERIYEFPFEKHEGEKLSSL